MNVLPRYLGRHYIAGESLVYDWAARLCSSYAHGSWHYFTLSNGGFYMAPANMGRVHVRWHLNGYSDMMGSDAFGITVTLFALCHLAEKTQDDTIIERFHQLREFATQHVEAANILRAID
ncbi:antirestriction protein [Paraburkholderia sp. J63]|uniref:antirestriction protein n=1 Tax=Paraburkholderia sp. J63 TaxID=2805434 RepID=UPI0039F456DA